MTPCTGQSKDNAETKPRLLIVDDEASIISNLSRVLRAKGYSVLEAASGKQALDLFRSEKVDLLLSDVKMPGLNGVQLLKAVKEINPRVPVILISGYHDEKTVVEALKAGAENFLTKPLNMEDLDAVIERSLSLACIRLATKDHLSRLAQRTIMEVRSNSEWIKQVINQIALSSVAVGYCDFDLDNNIKLALIEALSNAMEHGHGWDEDKTVHVTAEVDQEMLEVAISDEGQGFDHNALADPTDPVNLLSERGRGIFLMRSIMDEVHFNSSGTEITLRKKRKAR